MSSLVYVGRLPQGDEDVLTRPVGRWEPLIDDATWLRVQERITNHQRLPRQASQKHLLSGLLRCSQCEARMNGRGRHGHSRIYKCSSTNLGANTKTRACFASALGDQVDEAVLAEVLPLIEIAVSAFPELRNALETAWAALRKPAMLHGEIQERRHQQLMRETEQARGRLTKAAILYADGDIDKPGYELLRDKARADLDAATEELGRLEIVEPRSALPPLEMVLAAAEGCGAELRDGDSARSVRYRLR
jgi:hypothetical protein